MSFIDMFFYYYINDFYYDEDKFIITKEILF